MEERADSTIQDEMVQKEAPQLITILKEMKEGLDIVTGKIQALTTKVKANQYPTAGGISYLEAKHLLLLNYCQSLVYYLLRKAKGFSIGGHPVVRSLVEIRLFLEKIRTIHKKQEYNIQKLIRTATTDAVKADTNAKESEANQKSEDLLRYRPNPDMLVNKTDMDAEDHGGVYRPPKIAPTTMEEDKRTKQERNAQRKTKETLRQARHNEFVRSLMDDIEGRPEEVREIVGAESRELNRYVEKWNQRERQEEELFTRAPISKREKKQQKHLLKSRSGLLGLTDSFYDEIKSLPLGDGADEPTTVGIDDVRNMEGKHKKRKWKY